jgi:aspartyl-tRNA(Asn)/glutamyl-tRNA(Gln) amidotransferase subunit B
VAGNKLAASKEVAKKILQRLAEADAPAESIAKELGLLQSSDTGPVDAAIDALLATNPKGAQDYKAGKQAALGSLVGMIMKSTKGLNPKVVQERLKERLS